MFYVDADAGNDSTNDGSLRSPFKTLNKGLNKAWRVRHPIQNDDVTEADVDVVIKVQRTSTPIAPAGHGGFEPVNGGWQTYAEATAGTQHDPFPIRMIKRVSIEGVISNGQRPRITIDETLGGTFTAWDQNPIPRRALVHGAEAANLSNLFLDGTVYLNKYSDRVKGVLPENLPCFSVSNCRIEKTFDGIYFRTTTSSSGSNGSVIDCELIGLVLNFTDPDSEEQGHGGLWAIGPGAFNVSVSETVFQDWHDGLEVAGMPTTIGRLTLTNCDFTGNENGLEIVGDGEMTLDLLECTFAGNHNQEDGMPLFLVDSGNAPFSPAAILVGGMDNVLTVRSCSFFNCSFGGFVSRGALGTVDFGVTGSFQPGLNTFAYDFNQFPATQDPLRVNMYVRAPSTDATVTAGGNTWFHTNLNQGTSATGCLTGVFAVGPNQPGLNLVPSPLNPAILAPPGPTVGLCCDPATSADWKRNYALDPGVPSTQPGGKIDFGSDCLP